MNKQPTPQKNTVPKVPDVNGMSSADLVAMLDRRIAESKDHWNGKDFNLEKTTKENERWYYGRQISDKDDEYEGSENLTLDNRIFSSVRTVVPYVTTRVTEPEVYPSSNSEAAKKFAEDFEKALHIKADKENVKQKLKFALEDAIVRRRGYLKPRYDAATKNFCAVDYIPAESIIIDHKAKPGEEPRYFRHLLDKTIEDLITMWPEMKKAIYQVFQVDDTTPKAKMQESYTINEDWAFVPGDDGLDLICCWSYKKVPFGVIKDPNWRYGKENFLDNHMMPLVFLNVLSDGRGYIDKTTYVEQAKYLQKTVDKRSEQIGENAGLGNIGMPVVDSAALADDQAQYITFEPDTVLELDVNNAGKSSIDDVFTTWKAGTLSPDVYKDRVDAIEGIQNAFGASAVQQGNQTENNTLGQDELLRDQSMGRQQEIVDAIDTATQRLYLLMAQFMLVYGDDQELFRLVGEDSEFDYIIMNTASLDTNAEIRVKSGTSMPIDNAQRRATANAAAQKEMIDPLSYWEIMDKPNAQKFAKRLVDWTADPGSFLKDTQEEVFNRDAYVDIEIIKQGGQPPYREDLDKEYFDYLNQYILSGNLENPAYANVAQSISQFIDAQLARGQKMLGMAETQLPTPQDVNAHNTQVDQANAANAAAMKGLPAPPPIQTAPAQPTAQGQPTAPTAQPTPVQK